MKYQVVTGGLSLLVLLVFCPPAVAERINQEGRILGPLPVVTNAILFDTINADAVVSAMQIFPVTNPWNECISNRPVLSNSDAMIAQIVMDLHTNRAVLTPEFEMNYVLVPDNQPLVPIHFVTYPDDSDLNGGTYPYGLYPIPTNMPIEGWPVGTGTPDVVSMADQHAAATGIPSSSSRARVFSGKRGRRNWVGHQLAGGQRRDFQSEHQWAAAGRSRLRVMRRVSRCSRRWCATTRPSAA